MTILDQVYASGGDAIISTLELTCPAWTTILLCNGFKDVAYAQAGYLVLSVPSTYGSLKINIDSL